MCGRGGIETLNGVVAYIRAYLLFVDDEDQEIGVSAIEGIGDLITVPYLSLRYVAEGVYPVAIGRPQADPSARS